MLFLTASARVKTLLCRAISAVDEHLLSRAELIENREGALQWRWEGVGGKEGKPCRSLEAGAAEAVLQSLLWMRSGRRVKMAGLRCLHSGQLMFSSYKGVTGALYLCPGKRPLQMEPNKGPDERKWP